MIADVAVAFFFLVCLGSLASVNLHNIMVVRRRGISGKVYGKVERPSGLLVTVAALGTVAYFLMALLCPVLVLTGRNATLHTISIRFHSSLMSSMQIPGLALTGLGYFLFIWSVVARGRCAVSWDMPEDQKLVTWGPYRYVRHPSYLGYSLMFLGLFFLWPGLLTFLPLIAIPGYVLVTIEEEKLLLKRFGDQFLEYRRRTGRFIPKLR